MDHQSSPQLRVYLGHFDLTLAHASEDKYITDKQLHADYEKTGYDGTWVPRSR